MIDPEENILEKISKVIAELQSALALTLLSQQIHI